MSKKDCFKKFRGRWYTESDVRKMADLAQRIKAGESNLKSDFADILKNGTLEEPTIPKPRPSASGLGTTYDRYTERMLATSSMPEDYKEAIRENVEAKVEVSDDVIEEAASKFVEGLYSKEDIDNASAELTDRLNHRIRSLGDSGEYINLPFEVRALRMLNKRMLERHGAKAAVNIHKNLAKIASFAGRMLREFGLNSPDMLFIQVFGRGATTEAIVMDKETFKGSGKTNQEVLDEVNGIIDDAITPEVKKEVKADIQAKVAAEQKSQAADNKGKPKASDKGSAPDKAKESPTPKVKTIAQQRFADKADKYYQSYLEKRKKLGLNTGLDPRFIAAMHDYSMYLYYKFAGAVSRVKEEVYKQFGKDITNDKDGRLFESLWGDIITSSDFAEATTDIAKTKLLDALDKRVIGEDTVDVASGKVTPAQIVVQSVVNLINRQNAKARKAGNKNTKTTPVKKSVSDLLSARDLDIDLVNGLRSDILMGMIPLEEGRKAEVMNEIDDLLNSLVQDKRDIVAAPWITKSKIREDFRKSAALANKTIGDLVEDILDRNQITKSIQEEFISRTGMSKEEAAPYVKIIEDTIEDIFTKKKITVELNKALAKAYIPHEETSLENAEAKLKSAQEKLDAKTKELNLEVRKINVSQPTKKLLQAQVEELRKSVKEASDKVKEARSKLTKAERAALKEVKALQRNPTIEALMQVIRRGGLGDRKIRQMFAEALGASIMSEEDVETFNGLQKKVNDAIYATDQKTAKAELAKFAESLKNTKDKQIFIDMLDNYLYSNMLGGISTADTAVSAALLRHAQDVATYFLIATAKDLARLITLKGFDFQHLHMFMDAARSPFTKGGVGLKLFSDTILKEVLLGNEGLDITSSETLSDKRISSALTYVEQLTIHIDHIKKRLENPNLTKKERTKLMTAYGALSGAKVQAIMSRLLVAADYVNKTIILPFHVRMNMAYESRAELMKEGVIDPTYAEIANRTQESLGLDKVEAQLKAEGLSPGEKKRFNPILTPEQKAYQLRKKRIYYEFLPKDSMALKNALETVDKLNFIGRISGTSGVIYSGWNKLFNRISNKGKNDLTGDKSFIAALASIGLRISTAPFMGSILRGAQVAKDYTPLGLIQRGINEDGTLNNTLQFYKENRYTTGKSKDGSLIYDRNPLTDVAIQKRAVDAMWPAVVLGFILQSLFDMDKDEDGKWVIKDNPDSPWIITTSYNPADKTFIEEESAKNDDGTVHYDAWCIYKKRDGGGIDRIGVYKELPMAWPLAVAGAIQREVKFKIPSTTSSEGIPEQNKTSNPRTASEIAFKGLAGLFAFATQGGTKNITTPAAGLGSLLEGKSTLQDFAGGVLPNLGSTGIRAAVPLSSLQTDLGRFTRMITQGPEKKGLGKISGGLDQIPLISAFMDNTDFNVLGQDEYTRPRGQVGTSALGEMLEWLGSSDEERYAQNKTLEASSIVSKYDGVPGQEIKFYNFKGFTKVGDKQQLVEAPSDGQVAYDIKREAALLKSVLIKDQYDELNAAEPDDLRAKLTTINNNANKLAVSNYLVKKIEDSGYFTENTFPYKNVNIVKNVDPNTGVLEEIKYPDLSPDAIKEFLLKNNMYVNAKGELKPRDYDYNNAYRGSDKPVDKNGNVIEPSWEDK